MKVEGELTVLAPFSGWLGSIQDVPDAVFAGKMLGDGVALDPLEGVVRAPCAGTVIAVAPTNHSVTLRGAGDVDLLIHVGVDTVALDGTGFERLTMIGAVVRAGDELLRFDLDVVGRAAPSLVTPMIAISGAVIRVVGDPRLVAAGEAVMTVAAAAEPASAIVVDDCVAEVQVVVPLAHGLHARPAARIVAAIRAHDATIELRLGERVANARSVTSILMLGVRRGDTVIITGSGPDGAVAVGTISDLILGGMGESDEALLAAPDGANYADASGPDELIGVRAAPGGAIGFAFRLEASDRIVSAHGAGAPGENVALTAAIDRVRKGLVEVAPRSDIAAAHVAVLDDPELMALARDAIADGVGAGAAWRAACRAQSEGIEATGNPRLIERVADLRDVERQVIAALLGDDPTAALEVPVGCILTAQEVLPSELARIPDGRVAAIVCAAGGPTSHVAILATARDIPMIVSAGSALLDVPDGMTLLVEDQRAVVRIDPGEAVVAAHRTRLAERATEYAAATADAMSVARTADGVRIEVFANCGSADEAMKARSLGAEGCGLLRTEFLFLDRVSAPDEDEQAAAYATVTEALGDVPLIVRTLDAGSDKPLAYLPLPREENPALGLRGVRVSLARPALMRTQFRAILRGVPAGR